MRRPEFLGAIGAATAWPFAARAQQPAMQTIGFLNAGAPPSRLITSFRQNLAEAGHVEGRNLTTVYRFAEGKYDLLPGMAAELVQRQVAVIVASPSPAALRKDRYVKRSDRVQRSRRSDQARPRGCIFSTRRQRDRRQLSVE